MTILISRLTFFGDFPRTDVRSSHYTVCTNTDRILLVLLARLVRTWEQALLIVQPDTLLRWHRELFRIFWKRKSKAASRKPKVAEETIALPQANGDGESPSSALNGFGENY